MPTDEDNRIIFNSWDEIPEFASEEEEADWWDTHAMGNALLDQMRPASENAELQQILDPIRARRARSETDAA